MSNEMSFDTGPGYDGKPVILQHLVVDKETDVAFCAPVKVLPYDRNRGLNIPIIMCPACLRASTGPKVISVG